MLTLLLACAPPSEGLRLTPAGDGPVVRVDWDAKPLADIPFPNDLATRPDPTSPTGLRLNLPLVATTHAETEVREKVDALTGFGLYTPITVAFDAPLDLDDLALRHRDDPALGVDRFADDAILLVDVTPGSPTFGQPAEIDLGEGRFPMDAANSARYFPNDTRSAAPSLLFDTVDEDVNGDGGMSWGEDTDNDGVLDVPNVYPLGGDPRADLLTFYERATNTLIVRPVVPLREQTTYAVVLTSRLVGEDGSPVVSPWAWVNHTRQTEALEPLREILPDLGLSVDDVAFTWTFTTGDVTGDLVDIYRGLHGAGPFARLATDYPAGVTEAEALHALPGNPDVTELSAELIVSTLTQLGLFDGESADVIGANYDQFADVLVGGAVTVPYFLADKDDGGAWDADEWFTVDRTSGEMWVAPQRVVFTCVLPKEREGVHAPFPVALFGHGYGSSRFDMLGFSWAFARMGYAVCAADFPGHGPSISESDRALIEAYLSNTGLLPFLTHLEDSRQRDLDNDGEAQSGGDQWSADAFHTRDMVRQAVVDWMQLVRSFQACGTGEMTLPDGTRQVSCDWNGDGAPDLGGPDARFALVGGSLGGINAGVAAAVIPDVHTTVPIVPGGGLMDIGVRTEIGGAVEAMVGRLLSPMFLGTPTGDGGLQITQLVNSVTDMISLPVATLASFPPGGRIQLENLDNGEVREGYLPADGTFRLAVPCDAPDPFEKRGLSGMPASGPEAGTVYEVADNEGLGDRLVVRVLDASGNVYQTIDTWETEVVHEGVTMRAGSPLVAGSHGFGYVRASPDFRRTVGALSLITEPGDPIAYAPHYVDEPYAELGGKPVSVLIEPVPGDPIVNVATGIALARAAGFIERDVVDPRYGTSQDQFLIDHGVIEGLEEWGPYTCADGSACLFDADDLDDGTDGTGAPSEAGLRLTREHDGGVGGMRLPYVNPSGQHGFGLPEPSRAFDINTFAILQAATFVWTGGTVLSDDPCLEDGSCAWIAPVEGQ